MSEKEQNASLNGSHASANDEASQKVEDKMRQMQEGYQQSLEGRLEKIQQLAQAWLETEDKETLDQLYAEVHTLHGTAGTFGFKALSLSAGALESFIKVLRDHSGANQPKAKAQFKALLEDLLTASRTPEAFQALTAPSYSESGESDSSRILILEDDQNIAELMRTQLEKFGYQVEVVTELGAFHKAYQQFNPRVVIVDVMFPEGDLAGIEKVESCINQVLKEDKNHTTPDVIFISARQDLQARVRAVKAHGTAYFAKPLNMNELVDKVYELTHSEELPPLKVMVVDDDLSLLEYMRYVLAQVGLEVQTLSNTDNILEALVQFDPDLLLMDVHLPCCNGIDLVKAVHQHPQFKNLSVLFLSADQNERVRSEAVSEAGEDFITKPFHTPRFVTLVKAKAARAHEMKQQMVEDGLTGLLNHSYIERQLEVELEQAKRQDTELSVAMLDVDHFKAVNDTYGHLTGDAVLRSLAYLLKKRLRSSDIIGRFGGEEFVVIMPNTSLQAAKEVMDELRETFSEVSHQAGYKAFHVTFSAGISGYPGHDSAKELISAADELLYKAKQSGRNRVVAESSPEEKLPEGVYF
jgi:diguanylate cyclase (GGDEF)-like protein